MEILLPRLLNHSATFRVHSYKGIGHLPKGLTPKSDADRRILLDQLPRLLQGYGRVAAGTVVVICDLDDKDKNDFLSELNRVLDQCNPKPEAIFCLAIEEFEAWYLGDLAAIQKAYPKTQKNILKAYENDEICGTWELLADAVYKGGSKALAKKGRISVGEQKSLWATEISVHMDVENNLSPSFCFMRDQLRSSI